jgi:hypothetical protein
MPGSDEALDVVLAHPTVDADLGVIDRLEGLVVEELPAQGLVEPLHLAGRGR